MNLEEQGDEEWLMSILTKLFQKIEEVIIFNIFYETDINLMPKSDKESEEREITCHFLLMNTDAKILTIVFTNNPILTSIQTYQTQHDQIKFILETQGGFNIANLLSNLLH